MYRLIAAAGFGCLCFVLRSRTISFDGYALLDAVRRGEYWDPAHAMIPWFLRFFSAVARIFGGDVASGAQLLSAFSGGLCAWCLLPAERFGEIWRHPRTVAASLFLGLPVISSQFTSIEVYGPALASLFVADRVARSVLHHPGILRRAGFVFCLTIMIGTHSVMVLALPFLIRSAGGIRHMAGPGICRRKGLTLTCLLMLLMTALWFLGPELREFFHRVKTFVWLRQADGIPAALVLRLRNIRDLILIDAPLLFAALFFAGGLARLEGSISFRRLELCFWFAGAYLFLGVPVSALLLPVVAGVALCLEEYILKLRTRPILLGILTLLAVGQGGLSFRGHFDLSRRDDPLGRDLVRLSEGLPGPISVVSGEWCYHWRQFTTSQAVAVNEWTFAAQTRGEPGTSAWADVKHWVRTQQAAGRVVYLDYSGYRSLGVVGLPAAELDRFLEMTQARVVRDNPPIGLVPFRDL